MDSQQPGQIFEQDFRTALSQWWVLEYDQRLDEVEKVDFALQRPVGSKNLAVHLRVQVTTHLGHYEKAETFLRIHRGLEDSGWAVYLEVPPDVAAADAALAFSDFVFTQLLESAHKKHQQ